MTLKTSDLRAFLSAAGRIKTNTLMPVLSFIRFQDGVITKNNLRQFVHYTCEFEGEFMVEERVLTSFLSAVKTDTINITWTDKKVNITDGTTKVSSPNCAVKDFPINDAPESGWVTLDTPVINSIRIASKFLGTDDLQPRMMHVNVGKGGVAGTDAFILYYKQHPDVPEFMVSGEACALLSDHMLCDYAANDSYNFFKAGQFVYGFSKPECKFLDVTVILGADTTLEFKAEKTGIIAFNDLAIKLSQKGFSDVSFQKDQEFTMSFLQADYEQESSTTLPIECESVPKFLYNAAYMNRILKAVPDTELTFKCSGQKYYIEGDGYTCLIIGLAQAQ